MSLKTVFAVAALAACVSAGQAFAEGEGNGDPFPFQAGHQVGSGRAFVADTGSAAYPQVTGSTAQPSALARLEPVAGSEAAVQTSGSLPRGFAGGSVASAQARSVNRYWANRPARVRHLESKATQLRG